MSEAARGMKMSYRSAWVLVDSMNTLFRKPVVDTTLGGRGGGSATLTGFGADVIRRYRAMSVPRLVACIAYFGTAMIKPRKHESTKCTHGFRVFALSWQHPVGTDSSRARHWQSAA